MEDLVMRSEKDIEGCCLGVDFSNTNTVGNPAGNLTGAPNLVRSSRKWNRASAEWRAGEFYKGLPPKAMSEFESLATPFWCEGNTVLLTEEEEASIVFFLLEGRVKLTMNSIEGKRLTLGIAQPGEILGLAAVISGGAHHITAVAQFPCRLTTLPRRIFLNFLQRHPVANLNSAHLLSVEYKRSLEQLRTIGFNFTAQKKLARLLLQWSAEGQQTELGVRIQCSLTHEEIGECIGVSRETITRGLTELKNNKLLKQHGSSLLIPSLRALEGYAGKVG